MGHTRLGRLPRTQKWQEVVDLIRKHADTGHIAAAALDASKRGLEDVARDPALVRSFWLLTQLPLCARRENFPEELKKIGLSVDAEPTLMELVGGFSDAVDDHVYHTGGRTDLGEMAQMGAAETLTAILGLPGKSLFGTEPEDTRRELASLGTPANFSVLARRYFARLAEKYLAYFLSRELSNAAGGVQENQEFRKALALHCHEASKIVEQFASDWFSKANYKGRITPRKAAGFVSHALKKLRAELEKGAEGGKG